MKVNTIILGAGTGGRYGTVEGAKQFLHLNGKRIIDYSIEVFRTWEVKNTIYTVLPEGVQIPGTVSLKGGITRNYSTLNAMKVMEPCDLVFIHDAVRPFVDHRILNDCYLAFNDQGVNAVDVCIDSDDTLVSVQDTRVISVLNRANIKRGQTPQCFRYKVLRNAYDWFEETDMLTQAERLAFTDDLSVVRAIYPALNCQVVRGSSLNIKITYPFDMVLAEQIKNHKEDYNFPYTLKDKSVLILGSSGGIGNKVKEQLLLEGALVYETQHSNWDITNLEHWEQNQVRLKDVDSVIYSVGDASADCDFKTLDRLFDVNVKGVLYFFHYALENMKRGSTIVFLGSSSAYKGRSEFPLYSSTKAAAHNLFEGYVSRFEDRGININCIVPGKTKTGLLDKLDISNEGALDPMNVAKLIIKYCDTKQTGQIINIRR